MRSTPVAAISRSRSSVQRLLQLIQRFHLDLDFDPGVQRQRLLHHLRHATGRGDVVLLDQDAVPQRQALVLASAHTHRVLLRLAQARHGLARV